MEHLSLEIFDLSGGGSRYAVLPEDATITITDTSEVFGSGDVWSYTFALNTRANAHIFGSSGDMHGARLHEQVNKRRARLWVEGLPVYLGYLKLDDEVEVDADGNVEVSFESGQKTFENMIDGAKASQVPLMGDVKFGVALWRKRWSHVRLKLQASAVFDDGTTSLSDESGVVTHATRPGTVPGDTDADLTVFVNEGENDTETVQEYPRMVFPKGTFKDADTGGTVEINCLNTDSAYDEDANGTPTHPYCNVALCYQRYGYEKKNDRGDTYTDYNSEPEAQRGYEVMPANRVNSAPNFFVIYWLRALMKHLGIHVEENQMMGVEDLRRLFFVNTKCAYKIPKKIRTPGFDTSLRRYRFPDSGRLVPEQLEGHDRLVKLSESRLECTGYQVNSTNHDRVLDPSEIPAIREIKVDAVRADDSHEVAEWSDSIKDLYKDKNGWLHDAVATGECFPDTDISEVIRAIESGFGVRFLFSENYQRVRIVLLRNLFRSTAVQNIACEIVSDVKVENSTRGFRMTYGESEDTHFYYKGFADMLPHKPKIWKDDSDTHDYSKWSLNEVYADLLNKVSAFNKTCFVTPVTGNAYGIKIDKDAKRYDQLHPSLFEFAAFMDAEDGDCTGEEETIKTVSVGFRPAIMNDLNMVEERGGSTDQRFALFVDEKMRPRRPDLREETDYSASDAVYDVDGQLYGKSNGSDYDFRGMMAEDGVVKPGEFTIASDIRAAMNGLVLTADIVKFVRNVYYGPTTEETQPEPAYARWNISFNIDGHINEGYRLYLQDNYEPNDDGVSPIETHDWGLTLGIMRGSGSNARVVYSPDPEDREQNDTWEISPGNSETAHPDICDCYGRPWDYNGINPGFGPLDGRVSLKLRAEKPNPYFDPKQAEGSGNRRYLEITTESLRRRGLADQFYKEYSYWVRNARIARRQVRMTLAQLLTIDKTVRVTVGDITGFVTKMQYSVSNKSGLSLVTMEIMYI